MAKGFSVVVALRVLTTMLTACYPVALYLGLSYADVRPVAAALMALLVARAVFLPGRMRLLAFVPVAAGCAAALTAYAAKDPFYLRWYPVLISGTMLCAFAFSLVFPPSAVEMLAKLQFRQRPMPLYVKAYTRQVTKMWCLFFACNGLAAAYTVYGSLEIWTLYNGLISYILTALLFAGEWLYRRCVVHKRHRIDG